MLPASPQPAARFSACRFRPNWPWRSASPARRLGGPRLAGRCASANGSGRTNWNGIFPEMLEVVALGLRSGLSFDRSLQLYAEHFDTLLSRSCASTQRQWSLGLVTREQALRDLAATFDSPLFARVVENVVRSLRFGSSLAESLEAAAAEARTQFRSRKQEQVAKASVKMMVPTGALMLPAMLLLVLGPVLLELMEGF